MKATKCRKGERNFHQVWPNEIAVEGVGGETLCYFLPKQDTALVVIVKERGSIIHLLCGVLLFTQESAELWGRSAPRGTAGNTSTASGSLNLLHLNGCDLKPRFHCRACQLAPRNFQRGSQFRIGLRSLSRGDGNHINRHFHLGLQIRSNVHMAHLLQMGMNLLFLTTFLSWVK